MPVTTREWIGPAANEYVRRTNLEKIAYNLIISDLNKYGKALVNAADRYDASLKKIWWLIMGKIGYIETRVNSNLKSPVQKAITEINQAKYIASNLIVPYDFDYRTYTYGIDNELISSINELTKVLNMLNNSATLYGNVEKKLSTEINGISNSSLSLRKPAIK